jgi:hypothetical protein
MDADPRRSKPELLQQMPDLKTSEQMFNASRTERKAPHFGSTDSWGEEESDRQEESPVAMNHPPKKPLQVSSSVVAASSFLVPVAFH